MPHIIPQVALKSLGKEENAFEINLDALRAYDPVLANRVSCSNLKPHWEICLTEDGLNTVRKIMGKDHFYLIHSRISPKREAEKWAELIQSATETFALLGFALGYHVLALKRRYNAEALIIIEADLELFMLAMSLVDLTPILNDQRVHLFIGKEISEISDFFSNLPPTSISYGEYLPSTSLHPGYYLSMKEILERYMFKYRERRHPELSQDIINLLEETKA
jgi:hypothetical protein